MAKKRFFMGVLAAAVLVLLMLVCGGAFAGPLGWIGGAAVMGGGAGTLINIAFGQEDLSIGLGIMGGGLLLLLLDLAFGDSGSSTAQAPSENPVLRHVSFGVAPNAAYAGVNFTF